jgi:type III pantothenate kinase
MNPEQLFVIVIDVGNSNTVVSPVDSTSLAIMQAWRIATQVHRTPDEWRLILAALSSEQGIGPASITGVVVTSVVPSVTHSLLAMFHQWVGTEPFVVSGLCDLGLTLQVDQPEEVGADRLVNAVATYQLTGGPAIVVDAGTATKIDAVSEDGAFLGGAIAPGLGMGRDALADRAARLYAVEIRAPDRVIGRNTSEAIQSGVVFGHVTMIEGMIARFRQEMGAETPVILTGGFAEVIAGLTSISMRHEPDLTLFGSALVWTRQIAQGRKVLRRQ